MATATGNYVHDNSSLANFKNWSEPIFDAFTTFGWTQTADTGQTQPSSAGSVPSSAYLYFIFKAADTLASTLPIYVKVEYGFSSTVVRIRMTVGTGSDGSGNITNPFGSAPWQLTAYETNNGATTFPCFFSGDAGNFRMYLWTGTGTGNSNPPMFFGICRSASSSGTRTSDWVTCYCAQANSAATNTFQQTLYYNGGSPGWGLRDTGVVGLCPTSGAGSGAYGGSISSFPVVAVGIGFVGNALFDLACYVYTDLALDAGTCTIDNHFGSSHTFLTASAGLLGSSGATVNLSRLSNGVKMAFLLLYE